MTFDKSRRFVLWTAVFVVLIGIVLAVILWASSDKFSEKQEIRIDPAIAGDVILNTTLPTLTGRSQAVAQWRGQVLIVNFWATWCEPCREEMPALAELQEKYRGKGVQFVGISVDADDKKQEVAEFVQNAGIHYSILLGGLSAMELARRVGDAKSVLPFTLVVGRSGRAVEAVAGALKPALLEAVIAKEIAN